MNKKAIVEYDKNDPPPVIPSMSLRDYFAGQALIGVMQNYSQTEHNMTAYVCYAIADALLVEREK